MRRPHLSQRGTLYDAELCVRNRTEPVESELKDQLLARRSSFSRVCRRGLFQLPAAHCDQLSPALHHGCSATSTHLCSTTVMWCDVGAVVDQTWRAAVFTVFTVENIQSCVSHMFTTSCHTPPVAPRPPAFSPVTSSPVRKTFHSTDNASSQGVMLQHTAAPLE